MDQIEAVEAALKSTGAKIDRPWDEWARESRSLRHGVETWWLHKGSPLICAGAAEEVITSLTENEVEVLFAEGDLPPEDVAVLPRKEVDEVYSPPL